jgi:ADP-ribose pyrophosphatase
MDKSAVEILSTEQLYKDHFSVDKFCMRIRQFDGEWTGEFTRELYRVGRAVVVILFDPHKDALVMIEQFRIAPHVQGREAWMLEHVAGMIDDGETPDAVAHRETQEEAGCTIQNLERVCEYFISPATSDELITLFVGQVDSTKASGIHGLASEHENIRVHVKPVDEVLALADAGRLTNVNTLVGTLWFARNYLMLKEKWLAEP